MGIFFDDIQVTGHQRKGFMLPFFALAQGDNGLMLGCITAQVKPANSLDSHDFTRSHHAAHRIDVIKHGKGFVIDHAFTQLFNPGLRPALMARDWLGVITPIRGVTIGTLAIAAHVKGFHAGFMAVIGGRIQDREAGATIGAIGKWIAVKLMERVTNFIKAVLAGGDIRSKRNFHLPLNAVADIKS